MKKQYVTLICMNALLNDELYAVSFCPQMCVGAYPYLPCLYLMAPILMAEKDASRDSCLSA